jgi:hypothetical protein
MYKIPLNHIQILCQCQIENGGHCVASIRSMNAKVKGSYTDDFEFCNRFCPFHTMGCDYDTVVERARKFLRDNSQDEDNLI